METLTALTAHLDTLTALVVAFCAFVGALGVGARTVLEVLDRLDDRWPALRKVSDPLGHLLGGPKPRGKYRLDEEGSE